MGAPDRFFDESDLYKSSLAGVERLGDANSLNLERVALLKSDLILVNQYLERSRKIKFTCSRRSGGGTTSSGWHGNLRIV